MADKKREETTINSVIEEANIIFKDYIHRVKNDVQFRDLNPQAKYEYYMKLHIDFARQNPIILRHIASFGLHSPKAIRLYMKKCYSTNTDTDESFCERQADFVKYLYMYTGKHVSQKKLQEIWAQTKKHMMDEIEVSRKEKALIKERREKNKKPNDIERREYVKRLIELRRTDIIAADAKFS